MERHIVIENWKDTLVYGNQYNNYQDDDVEEDIIHTQYIGDYDEYVLVKSHIYGDGRDYHNYQIWNYEDLMRSDKTRDLVYLTEIIQEWEV